MTHSRRLSQAISEGDGISLIVFVGDPTAARAAEQQGAEGIAARGTAAPLRDATELPILCADDEPDAALGSGADAVLVAMRRVGDDADRLRALASEAHAAGVELVVDVADDEELALALERLDPEIFLISPRGADGGEEPLDRVLALLPDVPAGKLAIAEVDVRTRDDVAALERAGFDAVLVRGADVAELVGAAPPEV